MPSPVYAAVSAHLALEMELGGYEAAAFAENAIEDFYPAIASLINAEPREIAYIENATRAWDMAFYSIPFKPGDQVITHLSEYASNYLALLQTAKSRDIDIVLAPSNQLGQIDTQGLEQLVNPRTRLIAVTHVPSTGGLVNPVAEIGKVANKHGVLYLVDACQSVGQMPVDVKHIGCDLLAATGRKFLRGPRGTGFLFARKQIVDQLQPPFIDLQAAHWHSTNEFQWREDARRFENWERFIAGQIGLAVAARYASQVGPDEIRHQINQLVSHLNNKLQNIDWVDVQEPIETNPEVCTGIVTLSVNNLDKTGVEALHAHLRSLGIHVSAVLKKNARLYLQNKKYKEYLRVSPHYYNTTDEINTFCSALANLR